jgi:Holliday junction resolvasome RuvABC endonuclease subunit
MSGIIIIGIDPGLKSTGFAAAEVDVAASSISRVLEVGTVSTERKVTRDTRKTSDDLRRAKIQYDELEKICDRHRPSALAIELCTTTPYTLSTFSFGVMVGVVAGLGIPTIEVLPHELKRAVTGHKRATKADVISWAIEKTQLDGLKWPTSQRSNKLGLTYNGRHVSLAAEHPADALAAIEAALRTEQYRLAMQMTNPHQPYRLTSRSMA